MDRSTTDLSACAVRGARMSDINPMVELLSQQFAAASGAVFDREKARLGLGTLLRRPDRARVFVAESGGRLLGMASVQILLSTVDAGESGLLEDLVVAAAMRGRGIGRRLVRYAEAWGKRRGLLRLQVLADVDDPVALEFARRLGWRGTRLMVLRAGDGS